MRKRCTKNSINDMRMQHAMNQPAIDNKRYTSNSFMMAAANIRLYPRKGRIQKEAHHCQIKTGVAEHPQVFSHAGLLVNWPSGEAGLPFS